jgi:ABC-2 type transport system ATP-binding protein
MNSAVEIQGLTKSFAGHCALDAISLSIPKGSFFGLLGPNGAGKSTLIGCVAGLINADAGRVSVMGHDVVRDFRQARRALGLVPQELIDEPFFSIRQLLRIQAGYFGLGKSNYDWIDTLLQRLGLWEKRDAFMPSLSGGMKRRVLIALALVHKPPVLILDEPTAGVDIELRLSLWQFIRELHQQGHTIILTTHYLEEAEQLCEQIAIVRDGRLLALASTQQLLSAHPWHYVLLKLNQVVTRLPEALSAWVHGQQGQDWVLRLTREMDIAQLLSPLAAEGLSVVSVSPIEASLEDVFRTLMQRSV